MSIAGACWSAQNVHAGKGILRKPKKKKEEDFPKIHSVDTKIHSNNQDTYVNNQDTFSFENSVDPDQLASEEAS